MLHDNAVVVMKSLRISDKTLGPFMLYSGNFRNCLILDLQRILNLFLLDVNRVLLLSYDCRFVYFKIEFYQKYNSFVLYRYRLNY